MRPRNQVARDQLVAVLARQAATSASDLAEALDVSVPTLHRLLQEIGERVVVIGKARRTRYALRRPIRGDASDLPLYEVDEAGRAELLTTVTTVNPQGTLSVFEGTHWPVPEESRDGWWDGLPYPLNDMRPQGYMGRQFARAEHRQLSVPADPNEWSDDDVLYVLGRSGSDLSGSLILGDLAYERWLASKVSPPNVLAPAQVGAAYSALAEQAIAAGIPGSSVAGEFPKFTALREATGAKTPHVLVKFSGADGSPAVRRWADLLVCEHLALECIATIPMLASGKSRIVSHAGRTFLEVERFDRHGMHGRSRLSSLATLDAALIGDGSTDWPRIAAKFVAMGLLDHADAQRIQQLWWFGRLIANTDMHAGNLSFQAHGALALAPAYDMLPMAYAPLAGGELPTREFRPPLPLPAQRDVWNVACEAAVIFWTRASQDSRISKSFRATCVENGRQLQELAEKI